MKDDKIVIYTDGAARGNPGPAGFGAVIMIHNKVVEIGGRSEYSTNNIMELTGAIEALKYLKKENLVDKYPIEIYSDSKYVILGITEWISNWLKNNWKNAQKKPVLNKELWEELYELNKIISPSWHYVKGHSENKYNERADEIATSFADESEINLKNER